MERAMDRLKPRCPNCPTPLSHTPKTLINTGSNHPKRTLGTPRLSHTPKKVNKHGGFLDCPTVPYIHKRVGQTPPPSYEWIYRLRQVTTLSGSEVIPIESLRRRKDLSHAHHVEVAWDRERSVDNPPTQEKKGGITKRPVPNQEPPPGTQIGAPHDNQRPAHL